MAAAAYDVAALALKGSKTAVNFPEYVSYYPVPLSSSAQDIKRAAATAASLMKLKSGAEAAVGHPTNDESVDESIENKGRDFIDEEALFDMPNLMVEMANGMLVSPPRATSLTPLSDSPGYSDTESLWSY